MEDLKQRIDRNKLPEHIAVIMDGNGRWAKSRNMPRIFGHKNGVKAVREVSEACAEIGVKHLTLYAFSTENWNRPITEVSALMTLLVETVKNELKTLNENNIRLNAIGDISKLPTKSFKALKEGMEKTSSNTGMTMHLAINYSSRWEITEAVRKISADVQRGELNANDINEDTISSCLNTASIPDPELLIRTSGEKRISNYLLWQIAYAELYFTDVFWPDFSKQHLYEAILDFQNRERRFGKTGDQIRTKDEMLSKP